MKPNLSREQLVQLSSLYYRCEKYDDMITCAKRLISDNPDLTPMERNVFFEGYKFKLDKQRKSLIKLIAIEQKELKRGSSHAHLITEIKSPAIAALIETTKDFDAHIDILLEKSKNFNDMVLYNRYKCDFLRYRCQFLPKHKRESEVKLFMDICDKAEKIIQQYLSVTNIRHMELMLSKCVFLYEILNKRKDAIQLARNVIEPIKTSDNLDHEMKQILQIFKSNIIIWSKKSEADVII